MTFNYANFPAHDRLNSRLVREVTATGPASYATGGDPIDADTLGMSEIFGVYGTLRSGDAIRLLWWNYTTQALMVFVPNTDAEVADAVDLSGFTGTLLFTGR